MNNERTIVAEKKLKVLFIGNSFAVDTTDHAPMIAKALGITGFRFGTLYIGGCSINRHFTNITEDVPDYKYYVNDGGEWTVMDNYSIARAIADDDWDYICIQHGSGDGSRYTVKESYDNLAPLVKHVKELAGDRAVIAFNMAWVPEPHSQRKEITSFGGDQLLMYRKLTEMTQKCVAAVDGIDVVIPTGTAIQNARTVVKRELTRDTFHLSLDLGRYIAAMTLLKAFCGIDTDALRWCPDGVSKAECEIAKRAVNSAITNPYEITEQK